MKIITIDGIIGWDIIAKEIKKELKEAEGDEIMIEISSPGGSVYEGLAIFNSIRDYARNQNTVTTKIIGLAASMASYIALSGNRAIAEDNAVFMIHNVWTFSIGDHRDLRKDASEIEKLSSLLANQYAKKTGKQKSEIMKMMDDDSFFYGDEIKEAGFIDDIIITQDDSDKEKNDKLTNAIVTIQDCKNKMNKEEVFKNDLEKAAALIPKTKEIKSRVSLQKKGESGENKQENNKMNLAEIKEKYPDLYDQIFEAGQKEIQDNISAHAEWFDIAPGAVIEAIKNNEQYSVKHASKYAKAEITTKQKKTRQTEDNELGDINTPEDENDDVINAAFEKGLKGGENG